MPYVARKRRAELDGGAKPLTAGELNYRVTRLCDEYLNRRLPASPAPTSRPNSYAELNEVIGVLECAKLELYRRVAAPYEDRKRAENGDVYTPDRDSVREGTCEREGCERRFVVAAVGRWRRYCSDECRKLAWAGNPTCEVCGKALSAGGRNGAPRRCPAHNERAERARQEGRERTERAIVLRREGKLNGEIAAELGLPHAHAVTMLFQRADRYGLEVPPSPYRTKGRS